MKFLIFGSKGWLGGLIKDYLLKEDYEVIVCDHDINLSDRIISEVNVVINCAASTNIDWCEKNKWHCFWNNVMGAQNLARSCRINGQKYVFISSACIFESDQCYQNYEDVEGPFFVESDHPNPKCFYTETKVMAEKLIQEINSESLIIRPRLPISEIPHPRNTLNKLLQYDKINSNQESVTVIEDMLPVLLELILKNESGIFHLVNEGTISPSEMAVLLGHKFLTISKSQQDLRLVLEGRAKRVTTYVGSERISLLPNIRERIKSVVAKYKAHAEN